MFIKKFEAQSLEQALSLVKAELGPNALILSTENKKVKWFQKPLIEITAAYEQGEPTPTSKDTFREDDLLEIFPHRKRSRPDPAPAETGSIRKSSIERYADFKDPVGTSRPKVESTYETLFARCGLSAELATELGKQIQFDYPKKDLNNPGFLARVMSRLLASGINPLSADIFGERQRWVVVGISGAGKTSLLIKLALYLKASGQSVTLKSFDNQKLMGRRELASYARVIQTSFTDGRSETPSNQAGVELCDSPALPLSDNQNQSEAVWEEIGKASADRGVIMVIDSSMRAKEAIRVINQATAKMTVTTLAFTKLDLVSQHGMIYEVLKKTKLPLLGASISASFKTPFKFFEAQELASYILRP